MRIRWLGLALLIGGCAGAKVTAPELGVDPNLEPQFHPTGRWANVGKACSDAALGMDVPRSRWVGYSHGSDDRWATLARTAPGGVGGMLRNKGEYTIYLVDTTQFAAASTAVGNAGFPTPTAYLRGRWNFAQMFDWLGVILSGGHWPAGMNSFDINEATNRLEFGAVDSAALTQLDKALASMDLPCRLVSIRISPIVTVR